MSKRAPVAVLQMICAKRQVSQPVFEDLCSEEDSIFAFNVEAFGITRTAVGNSVKQAKHAAAQDLLMVLKGITDLRQEIIEIEEELVNFTGALLVDCSLRQLPKPQFQSEYIENDRQTTVTCSVENFRTTAWNANPKVAKEKAAKAMLEELAKHHKAPAIPPHDKKQRYFLNVDPERFEVARKLLDNSRQADEEKLLRQACKALDIPLRKFNVNTEEGPREIIEVTCNVSYVHVGERKKAGSEVLAKLKELLQTD